MRRLVYLGCVAGLALLAAVHSTRVAREGRELVALKEELRNVEAENRRLEAQVLELQSLARIEREATQRLGMVRAVQVAAEPGEGDGLPGRGPGRQDGLAAPDVPQPRVVSVPLAPAPASGGPAEAGAAFGTGAWRGPVGVMADLGRWLTRWIPGR